MIIKCNILKKITPKIVTYDKYNRFIYLISILGYR